MDAVNSEWADLMLATVPFDLMLDTPHRWALLAVRQLLDVHKPDLDESRSAGYMCTTCWDIWPCEVFQVIKGQHAKENGHPGE
jgi:hypothetical protein